MKGGKEDVETLQMWTKMCRTEKDVRWRKYVDETMEEKEEMEGEKKELNEDVEGEERVG